MHPVKTVVDELRWLGRAIRPTRKPKLATGEQILHAGGQAWIKKTDGTVVRAPKHDAPHE